MSSDVAIRFENVGKEYRVGAAPNGGGHYQYQSLGERLAGTLRSPLKALGGALRPPAQESFWALKDVSFDVKRGEVVGVIGRNGAGKSTLLKILSQITRPTTGHIEVRGRVGSLLEVGTGFHPELTGRENVFLNGAILGMRQREVRAKFDEIVAFAEVERFLDTPVKQYSSGMYTRLAFAVAAHLDPEVLVVDEVLAVGDAEFQKKCLGKMQDVAGGGRTVIFVSHNMGAVRSLCTKAVLLTRGAISDVGPASETVKSYLSMSTGASSADRSTVVLDTSDDASPIRFLSASMLYYEDAEGNNSRIEVSIKYRVPKQTSGVAIVIGVSHNGTSVFDAFDTDSRAELHKTRLPGDFVSTFQMNTDTFVPGNLTISIAGVLTARHRFADYRDVLSVQIPDYCNSTHTGNDPRRGTILRSFGIWSYSSQ